MKQIEGDFTSRDGRYAPDKQEHITLDIQQGVEHITASENGHKIQQGRYDGFS